MGKIVFQEVKKKLRAVTVPMPLAGLCTESYSSEFMGPIRLLPVFVY